MRSTQVAGGSSATYVLVLEEGDEVMRELLEFAREHHLDAAQISAIGGLRDVTVGYFDVDEKGYRSIAIQEQVEVLSFLGDVAVGEQGQPVVHAHVVVGDATGHARGGHFMEGHVRPTLEVVLTEAPAHLRRRFVPSAGLALIDIEPPRS
jgi:uncharacterized protein